MTWVRNRRNRARGRSGRSGAFALSGPHLATPMPIATPQSQRIANLDILRGLAILGILIINLPGFGTYYAAFFGNAPLAGWTPADQATWITMEVAVEGAQRGLLQLLFGAGVLLLASRAMHDDGPVAVADRYYRRNLWLLVFGLANIFLLLFPGDILFIYAIAALALFPFRRLAPATLLVIGLSWAVLDTGLGLAEYAERHELQEQVAAREPAALEAWAELEAGFEPDPGFMAYDRANRMGSYADYAAYARTTWLDERAYTGEIFFQSVPEAFCAMLLGMALFKWGILGGTRRRGTLLMLMLAMYAIALPLRVIEVVQHLRFNPEPRIVWFTEEIARLALTIGHLCLVNLVLSATWGRRLLSPLKAAGRTAFTLYLMQTLVAGWLLFPGFGLGLFGQFGWADMALISLAIIGMQVLLANLWLRLFHMGPVEWLWRSLVELKALPFRMRGQVKP